jgi:hypothetical protein
MGVGINKQFIFFLGIVFAIQIFQSYYFNSSAFIKNYDLSYWKDRFEHSQWQLPLSNRIIGDDGLYSYVGLGLIKGDDPSKLNPETPPVGKYLIGLSILIFNNPVFYSLTVSFLTIGIFLFLTKTVLKSLSLALFATILLFTDPMFSSQFWKPWIDITQLLFLLLNIFVFTLIKKKNTQFIVAIISGLSLGLFAQSKFPILLPVIILVESYFFIKNGLIKEFLIYLISLVVGILIPYLQYFMLGHGLLDFIKLQKYILTFYLKSKLTPNFGAFLGSIFFGNYQLIAGKGFERVLEWTILWPVSVAISFFLSMKFLLKDKTNQLLKYVGVLIIIFILIFSVVPSYARYLLLILPFAYIFLTYFINSFTKGNLRTVLYVLVPVFGLINSYFFFLPKPEVVLNDFYHNLSNQYFQDIFEEDIVDQPIGFTRNSFFKVTKNVMLDGQVEDIEVKQVRSDISLLADKGKVEIAVTYTTKDLGKFTENKTLNLVKQNSQWKIKWNWNIILNDYNPKAFVKTTINLGKRGSIIKNGKTLVADDKGYLISVNPSKINLQDEQHMLSELKKLAYIPSVHLQNAYLENIIPNTYIPLLTTSSVLLDQQLEELRNTAGIRVTEYPTRIYYDVSISPLSIKNTSFYECCTRIYSSVNYHGLLGPEKQYDSILNGYSGGKIEIIDDKGKLLNTILNKQSKNGKDVDLPL